MTSYRLVGVNRDARHCSACGRMVAARVCWVQVWRDGTPVGTPRPYGSECAAAMTGRTSRQMGDAMGRAPIYGPSRSPNDGDGLFSFMLD